MVTSASPRSLLARSALGSAGLVTFALASACGDDAGGSSDATAGGGASDQGTTAETTSAGSGGSGTSAGSGGSGTSAGSGGSGTSAGSGGSGTSAGSGGSGTGSGGADPCLGGEGPIDDVAGVWLATEGEQSYLGLAQEGACARGITCDDEDGAGDCYDARDVKLVDDQLTYFYVFDSFQVDADLVLSADGATLTGALFSTKCDCSVPHVYVRQ